MNETLLLVVAIVVLLAVAGRRERGCGTPVAAARRPALRAVALERPTSDQSHLNGYFPGS